MSSKTHQKDDGYYFKDTSTWDDDFVSPESYVRNKLKMLRSDMRIYPTNKEIAHLKSLKTRTAIDNAVHSIIDHHWDD